MKIVGVTGAALMREIDRSVLTWCSDHDPAHAVFHGALMDETDPTKEELDLGWRNFHQMHGRVPKRLGEVVFRKPTWDHIPDFYGRRAAPSRGTPATGLPFQPFEHWIYHRNRPKCVLRSHWIGLPNGGRFRTPTDPQGRLTEELGRMIVAMVERYGKRRNWSRYTHIADMKADARLALATGLLKFSPLKSNNPFAYATRTMETAFINSMRAHAEVWGEELHLGDDDIGEDGEGMWEGAMPETWKQRADREFDDGQRAFDRRK